MSIKNPLKWLSAAAFATCVPLANAQLLGVVPEAPFFDYNSGGSTSFNSADGNLTVNATPTFFTETAGGTANQIFALTVNPSVTLSVFLDTGCGLTGGDPGGEDLTIVGDIDLNADFVPEFSGTLITAEVLDLGFDAVVAGDGAFDAEFAVTGGELVTSGHYAVGDKIGMTIITEGTTFTGACDADWNGGAKGEIGILPVVEPPEKCYDIKKLWFQDSVAYRQCYGYGGNYGSKFKIKLAAECEDGFDPTNDLISVSLDGETIEFPPGAFDQDVDNLSKFNAHISGRPSVSAVLDCSKGTFSLRAYRADISQVDFNDGVDVRLILGTWDKTMNAPVTPHHTYNGYNLTWKYWNPAPADCSNPDYEPPACETQWESVKVKHLGSGDFFHFDGNFGSEILLNHEYEDEGAACSAMASIDSSCGTSVTCGDIVGGFKVMRIEHKNDSLSCDITTHHGRYHDRWSWKRSKHW